MSKIYNSSASISKRYSISQHKKEKPIVKPDKKQALLNTEESLLLTIKKFCFEENVVPPTVNVLFEEKINENFSICSTRRSVYEETNVQSFNADRKSVKEDDISLTDKELRNIIYYDVKDEYKIFAVYDNPDLPNHLSGITIRSFNFEKALFNVFHKIIYVYNTISTLKLEYCQLQESDIEKLADILEYHENINDLSIDGNPNRRQNFHILVESGKLASLSMKHCIIVDKTVKNIATGLLNTNNNIMKCLNLSCNNISDNGMEYLVKALRINRSIVYLGLADNYITDRGCLTLVNILQKFPLEQTEIVLRRHMNMERLRIRNDMINLMKRKLMDSRQGKISDFKLKNDLTKKRSNFNIKKVGRRSTDSQNLKASSKGSIKNDRPSKTSDTIDKISQNDLSKIQLTVSKEIGGDNHPLITECYPENKQVFCKGNFILSYINLAFNKITKEGAKAIQEMLMYQRNSLDVGELGVKQIVLDGNMMSEFACELKEIASILQKHKKSLYVIKSTSGYSTEKRKRSLSGKMTSSSISRRRQSSK